MDSMKKFSTSVAICTFNGMKHLPEQLRTIESQVEPPDQIVISDDNSSDGTVDYLQDWQKKTRIRSKVLSNAKQLGICRNFWQAASHCDGDLIFACDQDDIWHPEKTRTVARHFESPRILLVHSNANLVDGDGRPLGSELFDTLSLSRFERTLIQGGQAFEVYLKRNIVTGATMAFRRELLDLASPLPDTWMHDAWLAINASIFGTTAAEPACTIDYRQHSNNLIGAKTYSPAQRVRRFWWRLTNSRSLDWELENQAICASDLLTHIAANEKSPAWAIQRLKARIDFARARRGLPRGRWKRAEVIRRSSVRAEYAKNLQEPKLEMVRDFLRD
jgi:glycosyltransferase involved in cell wall biosynthesis